MGFSVKYLPNVANFKIMLGLRNRLFQLFGVNTRVAPRLEFSGWLNNASNKFVYYRLRRLFVLSDKIHRLGQTELAVQFWQEAWQLMSTEPMLTMAYNKIRNGWHRDIPLWKVKSELSEVRSLVRSKSVDLDYKRVYIPKPGDKWRPLGVPTPSWRVYLHMYNCMLAIYVRPLIHPSQHGYQAGKGVLTAWEEIVSKLNSPNIYEFDLKQFFPRVSTQYLSRYLLERASMPLKEVY